MASRSIRVVDNSNFGITLKIKIAPSESSTEIISPAFKSIRGGSAWI